MALNEQMELFDDGGLKEEGGSVDPVSGNDVPIGSTKEEVRDDIPAQLSEGEFVFPADVVRYIGLEKLMKIRQDAKQGLKQMEAMGQMGNSDEATMPDDLPFSETDLDMEDDLPFDEKDLDTEDDLEYTIGGYVPPPYTPPQMKNVPTITPPPMSPQMGLPYTPSLNKQIESPVVNFQQLVGGAIPTKSTTDVVPSVKLVRYFNETTQQVRMIPHLTNPDGSQGETLYPVPEGFAPKEEAPKQKAKQTTVPTSKVAGTSVREEGGDDSESIGGAVDPAGDKLSYSTLTNLDALDKNMKEIGNMQMNLLGFTKPAGVMRNVAISAFGKANLNGINLGAITSYYTQAKKDLGVFGKDIKDLSPKERNALNNSIERAKTSVISLTTDASGNAMSQNDIVAEVNNLAGLYGLKEIDRKTNWNIDVKIGKKIGEIDKERDKVKAKIRRRGLIDPQQGFDPDEQLGLESLSSAQQKGIQDALESGKGSLDTSGIDVSDISTGVQGIGEQSDPGGSAGEVGGGSGYSEESLGGLFNQGGLAGKKKTRKPKKMKRGGLASR